MIREIPKPDISPNFTVEDIHKIREWNYERLKDATLDEQLADYKRRANEAFKEMDARRNSKTLPIAR